MTPPVVLVVDDDSEIRDALVELLGEEDFHAVGVSDGVEALDWLRDHAPEVCLVLLDLMMPNMDGRTFLTHKRTDPRLASIPVVVMTAEPEDGSAPIGDSPSVLKTLRKPIHLAVLLEVVREASRGSGSAPSPRGS